MKYRLFIAIDLSPRVKKQLDAFIKKLAPTLTGVKWEREEKLHLTLKYLGGTVIAPAVITTTIERKLKESKVAEFVLSFGELGAFVGNHNTLFLEVEQSEPLLRLYHMINNCLEPLGFRREKLAFSPHVTLGRSRSQGLLSFSPGRDISYTIEPMVVEEVVVFQSKNGEYRSVGKIALVN